MAGALVVTGSSRGIGAAVARLGGDRGYGVCVNYRERADRAVEVVETIRARGGSAIAVRADVSVDADVRQLFAAVDEQLGPITALVNNASIIGGECRVDETEVEALAEVFAVNVFSSFLCAREAVRRMSPRYGGKGGAIVNVSSGAAKLGGFNGRVRYAASKGAVESFTIGLAREVATENIRVNCVRSGPADTEIHDPYGGPAFLEQIKTKVPMQRIADPDEIARAILWLLSDEATFTTATILDVSGGQ
jgi:NAD(P)-dependent dehydrogenase (short-subunit alcohol dehydrogenase family)